MLSIWLQDDDGVLILQMRTSHSSWVCHAVPQIPVGQHGVRYGLPLRLVDKVVALPTIHRRLQCGQSPPLFSNLQAVELVLLRAKVQSINLIKPHRLSGD